MNDLIVGIGLVCIIEGLLWALAPQKALSLLEAAAAQPEKTLRTLGLIGVVAGLGLVWLVRG